MIDFLRYIPEQIYTLAELHINLSNQYHWLFFAIFCNTILKIFISYKMNLFPIQRSVATYVAVRKIIESILA